MTSQVEVPPLTGLIHFISGKRRVKDYESVLSDSRPKSKCRSLWTIFHGLVILCYILKTTWCMTIIVWDYGSVWHSILPQNKCRSFWPIFHSPVILSDISHYLILNVIFTDNDTVWPKLWPQSKYKSAYTSWSSDFSYYLLDYFMD